MILPTITTNIIIQIITIFNPYYFLMHFKMSQISAVFTRKRANSHIKNKKEIKAKSECFGIKCRRIFENFRM